MASVPPEFDIYRTTISPIPRNVKTTPFERNMRIVVSVLLAIVGAAVCIRYIGKTPSDAYPALFCTTLYVALVLIVWQLCFEDFIITMNVTHPRSTYASLSIVVVSSILFFFLVSMEPGTICQMSDNSPCNNMAANNEPAIGKGPELLPIPEEPTFPSDSLCNWMEHTPSKTNHTNTFTDADDLLNLPPLRRSYPPPEYWNSTHVGVTSGPAKCGSLDVTILAQIFLIVSTIPVLARGAGIDPEVWDQNLCVELISGMVTLSFFPVCAPDCGQLGVCESDCERTRRACGPILDLDFAAPSLKGGRNYFIVESLIDARLLPCYDDIMEHMIIDRCDASLFNTEDSEGGITFAKPGDACIPLNFASTTPNTLQKAGSCSFLQFSEYEIERSRIFEYNRGQLEPEPGAASSNDTPTATDTDREEDAAVASYISSHASFRAPASAFLLVASCASTILTAVSLSLTAKKMARKVSPSDSLRTINECLSEDEAKMAASITFSNTVGFSALFCISSLVGITVCSAFLGLRVEIDANSSENFNFWLAAVAVLLYVIFVVSTLTIFHLVFFWRTVALNQLANLLGLEYRNEEMYEEIPEYILKWLAAYERNFGLAKNGPHAIWSIFVGEVFECVIQISNANIISAFTDWPVLLAYLILVSANFLGFGLLCLAPEKLIGANLLSTMDVLFDLSYIFFNIVYIKKIVNYSAILIPLAFSARRLPNSFKGFIRIKMAKRIEDHFLAEEASISRFKESQSRTQLMLIKPSHSSGVTGAHGGVMLAVTKVGEKRRQSNIEKRCNAKFGSCVWSAIEPKLYFKDGLFYEPTCSFGTSSSPISSELTWVLDISECEAAQLLPDEYNDEYSLINEIVAVGNVIERLPVWMTEGSRFLPHLKHLDLSSNRLTNFELDTNTLPNLNTLDISSNAFVRFPDFLVSGETGTLVRVDISNNQIQDCPIGVMSNVSVEVTLNFDGNPMSKVIDWSGLELETLPVRLRVNDLGINGNLKETLTTLRLGDNNFNESIFYELSECDLNSLADLDVSRNKLTRLSSEDTRHLPSLTRLSVSGHSSITNFALFPEDIHTIDASNCAVDLWNTPPTHSARLQHLDLKLYGNPTYRLSWEFEPLMTIIPTWLRTLDNLGVINFSWTSITGIPADAFPPALYDVRAINILSDEFDFNENAFRLSTQITLVVFNGVTGLRSIPSKTFDPMEMLVDLDLGLNPNLILESNLFSESSHGFPRLKKLKISGVANTVWQFDQFKGLGSLLTLVADSRSLKTIEPGAFKSLTKLKSIYLHNTELELLTQESLEGLGALVFLNLDRNRIIRIDDDAFLATPKLKYLTLLGSKVTRLNRLTLNGLNDLVDLDLRGTSLAVIEDGAFSSLSSLASLRLDDNLLTSVSAATFSGLSSLVVLFLGRNSLLSSIGSDAFLATPMLSSLIVSGCGSLETIGANAFAGLPVLVFLDLSDNSISTLSAGAFSGMARLKILTLEGNKELKDVGEGLFSSLASLKELLLPSSITKAADDVFLGLSSLETLVFESSNASIEVGSDILKHLPMLKALNTGVYVAQQLDFSVFPGSGAYLGISPLPLGGVSSSMLQSYSDAICSSTAANAGKLTAWKRGWIDAPAPPASSPSELIAFSAEQPNNIDQKSAEHTCNMIGRQLASAFDDATSAVVRAAAEEARVQADSLIPAIQLDSYDDVAGHRENENRMNGRGWTAYYHLLNTGYFLNLRRHNFWIGGRRADSLASNWSWVDGSISDPPWQPHWMNQGVSRSTGGGLVLQGRGGYPCGFEETGSRAGLTLGEIDDTPVTMSWIPASTFRGTGAVSVMLGIWRNIMTPLFQNDEMFVAFHNESERTTNGTQQRLDTLFYDSCSEVEHGNRGGNGGFFIDGGWSEWGGATAGYVCGREAPAFC